MFIDGIHYSGFVERLKYAVSGLGYMEIVIILMQRLVFVCFPIIRC